MHLNMKMVGNETTEKLHCNYAPITIWLTAAFDTTITDSADIGLFGSPQLFIMVRILDAGNSFSSAFSTRSTIFWCCLFVSVYKLCFCAERIGNVERRPNAHQVFVNRFKWQADADALPHTYHSHTHGVILSLTHMTRLFTHLTSTAWLRANNFRLIRDTFFYSFQVSKCHRCRKKKCLFILGWHNPVTAY